MAPTHTNTSEDAAEFESCDHRFVHAGGPGWGVAVVDDSTCGHDVTRTVRFSPLHAPRFPTPGPTGACTASGTRCRPARASGTP
jgi:alpha-mannosidase